MAIAATVDFTAPGGVTENDVLWADEVGAKENAWRASQDPPLAELPLTTNAERLVALKAYWERIIESDNQFTHKRIKRELFEEAKERAAISTNAQLTAAIAQLAELP